MPAKQLIFRSDARAKLLRGASALADAARITLGPRSKSVPMTEPPEPPKHEREAVEP
jgi:chaperonin GroEL (HSP60 family)